MRCGLFGKLPSKRDFIAVATPRTFLSVWEPWIQSAIAASRALLATGWQEAFLTAPIWRYWLGADLCGATVMGAVMPSIDGIGRYFPLTLLAIPEAGEAIAPPEIDAQEPWFATVEDFLFTTLDQGRSFEEVTGALAQLSSPITYSGSLAPGVEILPQGAARVRVESTFSDAFARARLADHTRAYAASTYWWTAGGEAYERLALSALRMPDPYLFAGMLTGRFDQLTVDVASPG